MPLDLHQMREDYRSHPLRKKDVSGDPFVQFNRWFEEVINAKVTEPNAFVLSTLGKETMPSARVMLLKEVASDGYIFYTNYLGQKADEIAANPQVHMLFAWLDLARQIRIKGQVVKVSEATSAEYFSKRPRQSQIAAHASEQSKEIDSREQLERIFKAAEKKYENKVVPLPSNWGGYKIIPSYFEFWQGRANRYHDRICYELADNLSWRIFRLAP